MERSFYERDVVTVARELIGRLLVHDSPEGRTSGVITETEAYSGINDPACHAYPYKRTKRTEVLFGPGGHAFVYLIYGMYHCMNVSANIPGQPEGVLIRSLEPVEGIELMKKRDGGKPDSKLCLGPGRLCRAMGIGMSHYGYDLCGDTLFIEAGTDEKCYGEIKTSPRINIDYAGYAKDWPWRFYI